MAEIKKGDPVLFYGKSLHVVDLVDKDGRMIAEVADVAARELRDANRAKILELRERQVALKKGDEREQDEIAQEIAKLDAPVMDALFTIKLRADLLSWWEDRKVWVSDGRILSDDQIAAWTKMTGKAPTPAFQRVALTMLESHAAAQAAKPADGAAQ